MTRDFLRKGAFALALICFSFNAHAQQSVAAKLERYMDGHATFHDFSGAVLVMRDGKVLLRKAYGLADREWGVANTVDTKFRIASISKPFTAVAVLKLAEQGKLSLEDKLEKFIPGLPDGDRITLHMMLSHQSGFPPTSHADASTDMAMTREKVLEILRQKPLDFEPGTRAAYSNTAFLLLAYVIEAASGESFTSFMEKNVLKPAGLQNSGFYDPQAVVPKKARHYLPERTPAGTTWKNELWRNYSLFHGHGSMYSTIDDVARFLEALGGTALLSESSLAKMMTLHREGEPWGYGIRLNPVAGRKAYGHAGRFSGAWVNAVAFPADDVVTVVFSNNLSDADSLNHALAALTFGEDVPMPYRHVRAAIDFALLDKYAGRYGRGVIVSEEGKLLVGKGKVEIVPESPTKFFEEGDPNNTYEFVVDGEGKVTAVVYRSYATKEVIPRSN